MGIKQAKQSKQVNNQISKQAGSLNAASQRLRPPSVARVYHSGMKDPKSCFKIAQIRICTSWDSQISQTVYLSLQLQNHMEFGIRWSWRVSKKISKLPSWRGLQKNHAQLQFSTRFPCKLKMSWVWVWPNFEITLVRGSHELLMDQKASKQCNKQQIKQNQANQASLANQASQV